MPFPGKPTLLPPPALPRLLPFMEKYRQYWCPTSLQANAWLPSGLTTASSDWFVLGPGLEENRFPKKAVKKNVENIHSPSVCTERGREVF